MNTSVKQINFTQLSQRPLLTQFNIPDEIEPTYYVVRVVDFIKALLSIESEFTNQYVSDLEAEIDFLDNYSSGEIKNSQKIRQRYDLHSYLKSHPLFSTLMLLPTDTSKASQETLYLMLAKLYLLRSANDYKAYLAFYQALLVEQHMSVPLAPFFIQKATAIELRVELESIALISKNITFAKLASFYQARKKIQISSAPLASNSHRFQLEFDSDTHLLALQQETDLEGNIITEYLELAKQLGISESKDIMQQKRIEVGILNALYTNELKPVWGMSAAIPAEVGHIVSVINNDFIDADFSTLSISDAKYLLIFFLKLLGLTQLNDITLLNRTKKNKHITDKPNILSYKLNAQTLHIDAQLTLKAALLQVAPPMAQDQRLHYQARETLTLDLPYPIGSLLNIVLRDIPASLRQNTLLYDVLQLNETAYKKWLNNAIKAANLKKTGLSVSKVEGGFLHFAKERLPEVAHDFLSGNAGVQHHYISLSRDLIIKTLRSNWFNFLESAGIKRQSLSAHEARPILHSSSKYHDEVGSSNTIRDNIIEALLAHFSQLKIQISTVNDSINALNIIAFYLYLRIATSTGLRPVIKPFPEVNFWNQHQGYFTVADKRVHHQQERRLIVLSKSINELIVIYRQCAQRVCAMLAIPMPIQLIALYTDHGWVDLSHDLVTEKLHLIFNDKVFCRSLRHVAARQFLKQHINRGKFSQSALNLLMNHSRANASVLNERYIPSLSTIIEKQRVLIEQCDAQFLDYDTRVHQQLQCFLWRK